MATYVILPDTSSAYTVRAISASWSTARAGGGTRSLLTNTAALVAFHDGDWRVFQALIQFDTSVVEGIVLSASLNSVFSTTGVPYTVHVRANSSWSYPLDFDSMIPGATLAGNTLLGSAQITTFEYVPFSISADWIQTSGLTKFVYHDSRQASSSTPGGHLTSLSAGSTFRSPSHSDPPQLVIHTVNPSTLMGVHDASVQLSDGSTVYLESDGATEPLLTLNHVATDGTVTAVESLQTSENDEEPYIWPKQALSAYQLAVDDQDNVYFIHPEKWDLTPCRLYEYVGGTLSYVRRDWGMYSGGGNRKDVLSALWCGSGLGDNGQGFMLVINSNNTTGAISYVFVDANMLHTGSNPTTYQWGESPSWLVSSSSYRNRLGTGASLATDVFGGNRVASLAYSNYRLSTGSISHHARYSIFDISSSGISNVQSNTWSTSNTPALLERVRVIGLDPGVWLAMRPWSSNNFLIRRIGDTDMGWNNSVVFNHRFWDAVHDGDLVWLYYVESDKIMRIAYDYQWNFLDDNSITEVATTNTNDPSVRAVKDLRDKSRSVIHVGDEQNFEMHIESMLPPGSWISLSNGLRAPVYLSDGTRAVLKLSDGSQV